MLNLSFDNFHVQQEQNGLHPSHFPLFSLLKYYKKLKDGTLLDEILEHADAEEELFLAERINLLKAYQDSLSQRKLIEVITSMSGGISLNKIISRMTKKDLVLILNSLPMLQKLEEQKLIVQTKKSRAEVPPMRRDNNFDMPLATKSLIFEDKPASGDSFTETRTDEKKILRNLDLDTSFTSCDVEKKPKGLNHKQEPVSFTEMLVPKSAVLDKQTSNDIYKKYPKKSDSNSSQAVSLHFFDAWRKPEAHNQKNNLGGSMKSPANKDPNDDQVVNFGNTLQGSTFKEILDNNEKFYAWFKWLKYKHLNVTCNQDCAIKAYNYFSKHLDYWDKL